VILPERGYVTFWPLLSQIRLSVVCNVRAPYSGVETYGNISSPFCILAIPWPPCKILQKSSQRSNVRGRGVKRKTGNKTERWYVRVSHLLMSFL